MNIPGYCSEPGCDRPATRTGKCSTCMQIERDKERKKNRPQKEPTYLNKVSDKRSIQLQQYNSKVERWKKGKNCLMCDWEGVKKPCEHAHHQEGREGNRLLDFTKIVPLCAKHHIWVTEHSKEAIELGISLPRNT